MRKVVSLSPGTTEIFGYRMNMIQLAGRTASCNYPSNVASAPVVLNGVKPNYEMIIAANPDAIVYDPMLFSDSDLKKFEDVGIKLVPIGAQTVKEFVKRLYEVGSMFTYETAIMEYVGEIERTEQAAMAAKPKSAPRVAVVMPDSRGSHMVAGTESFLADVVRICGGEVVGPKSAKFELASVESLVSWNPELIACTPKFEWLTGDARLQSIKAIQSFKQGRATIAQLNADVALRQGCRVDSLIINLSKFISGTVVEK